MTESLEKKILERWPVLYHVAHRDALDAILSNGLLCTRRLVEEVGVDDATKQSIVREHRPESIQLSGGGIGTAVIRDQKPMSDSGLRRALPAHLTPADWYSLLNDRVFFWLTEERLFRFLKARAYREREHLVLSFDTARVLAGEWEKIELSPINSGATKPMPRYRDESFFAPIEEYPWSYWGARRPSAGVVVELCVRDGVPDVREYLKDVRIMRQDEVLSRPTW